MVENPSLLLVVIVAGLLLVLDTQRRNRRFLARLDQLARREPIIRRVECKPPDDGQDSALPDWVQQHREALLDGFMRGSGQMFLEDNPHWRRVNDLAVAALDAYIEEYPYYGQFDGTQQAIDNVTIRAALQSSRRTITRS